MLHVDYTSRSTIACKNQLDHPCSMLRTCKRREGGSHVHTSPPHQIKKETIQYSIYMWASLMRLFPSNRSSVGHVNAQLLGGRRTDLINS